MKLFKNRIFIFILGGVFFGSITGVVAYGMAADNVSYTPKDNNWNVENVDQALNDLYTNRINQNSFGTTRYATSAGDLISKRTSTLSNVSKGKYMVVVTTTYNWTTYASSWPIESGTLSSGNLSCNSSNCQISFLGGYFNTLRPTGMDHGYYSQYASHVRTYYVEIKENNDSLSSYISDGNIESTYRASHATITAIPVN